MPILESCIYLVLPHLSNAFFSKRIYIRIEYAHHNVVHSPLDLLDIPKIILRSWKPTRCYFLELVYEAVPIILNLGEVRILRISLERLVTSI